jgi:hypothetical protein
MARELAAKGAGEEEQRNCYRLVRDEIRAFVETLPDALRSDHPDSRPAGIRKRP